MTYKGICLTKDILTDNSVFLSKEHAGQDVLTQEGVDLFRHRVQRECAQQQRKEPSGTYFAFATDHIVVFLYNILHKY